MILYLKGITIVGGSNPITLPDMSWGFEKFYIWFLIVISSSAFAVIPWIPGFFKKIFRRNWEK
jgi:hypothetical protein